MYVRFLPLFVCIIPRPCRRQYGKYILGDRIYCSPFVAMSGHMLQSPGGCLLTDELFANSLKTVPFVII